MKQILLNFCFKSEKKNIQLQHMSTDSFVISISTNDIVEV